ncbi:TRAP transporter permease [Pelagibacterium sediminicola]|uniref:TRAP transporter permease n=1 Tax=Pelagibacterium sediminicola TaxID=2248761 RepID=UPI000E3106CF|nr:TRAP transporter fused permease subunit [Pelagibacterium sediminicola]
MTSVVQTQRPSIWRQIFAPDMPDQRVLSGANKWLVSLVAISFALFYIHAALRFVDASLFLSTFIGFTGFLTFLIYPATSRSPKDRPSLLDWVLALATLAFSVYYVVSYMDRLMNAGGSVGAVEAGFSAVAVIVCLEMCRRLLGPILPTIALVLIAYNFWGPYFPSMIAHNGISPERFVSYAFSEEGIFGVVTSTFATYVFLFIVFGTFLQTSSIGQMFIDLAFSLFGRSRGGAGKVAVVASGLIGSVLGSGAGNVVVTGSITIPLMKKHGFKPTYAGGIESVASLGGHLMPPIMGGTAFVVAAFTRTDYATILAISVVPAILYYLSLFMSVHFHAAKHGIGGLNAEELPEFWTVLKRDWILLIPVILLIAMLAWGYSAYFSAVVSTLSIIVVKFLRSPRDFRIGWIFSTLEQAAKSSLMVGVTGGIMGVVLAGMLLPGLVLKFSSLILSFSFGLLPLLIVLIILISYLFGMGMTVLASYIILSIVAQPAMLEFGIPLLTIHMMLLWISQDASITPPFCINSFVAANIAKANPMKTGMVSVMLGKPLYIIPVLFVYTPMLMDGPWGEIIATWVSSALGFVALAAALEGYMKKSMSVPERLAVVVASVLLFWPGLLFDLAGLFVLAAVYLVQRRANAAPVPKTS